MKVLTPKKLLDMLNKREDVYCHISTYINKDNKFIPRIPSNLDMYTNNENDSIDRICVSSSLKGALQAIPQGGQELFSWYEDNALYFKVFIIDTLKLGIKKEKIYSPDYLVSNHYVHDAKTTGEHWITEEFEVPEEFTFLINLKSWNINEKGIIDKIDITTDFIYENESIELDLEYANDIHDGDFCIYEEKEYLKKEYLKINPDIYFTDKKNDSKIILVSKKNQSIYELMKFDSFYKSKCFLDI